MSAPRPEANAAARAEPRALDGYCLLRPLGEGGMSTVYLAYHPQTGEQVAVKVLPLELANDQLAVRRFVREVKLCTTLRHPNIVRGIDSGRDPETGRYYLVMEYVAGPTAQVWLDRFGRMSLGDAVAIALDIARALEHLHARDIVHRDIKPDNVLLSPAGAAKLGDFGLAKPLDSDGQLTVFNAGFGTSHYMPYEQALNARFVDGRSDVFALGATLYHLLTGEVPFSGANHLEVVAKKEAGIYRPAREVNAQVPAALEAILTRMLARDPRQRFQTASDLIVALERSGLAAGMPSFGELDVALQDPHQRARLTANTAPTRPDLPQPTPPEDPAFQAEVWCLRWQDRAGRGREVCAPAAVVLRWWAEGRLPPDTLAARPPHKQYRPLRDYPEFQKVPPAPSKGSDWTGTIQTGLVVSAGLIGFASGLLQAVWM